MKSAFWFAVAGVVGYLVDAGVLLAVAGWLGPYLGRFVSFCAAVLATWLMNRRLAFGEHSSGVSLLREFARYFVVCLGGGAVNLAAYSALVHFLDLSRAWLPAAVAGGSLAGMTMNFTLSKRLVFARGRADEH